MVKRNNTPFSKCPLCGYALQPLHSEESKNYFHCSRKICGHIVLKQKEQDRNREAFSDFPDYRQSSTSLWDKIKDSFWNATEESKTRKFWEELFLPETPGTLLEIGYGDLSWVLQACQRGWITESIHPNPASAEEYENKGIRVQQGIPEWSNYTDESFDAVVIRWALEEIDNPVFYLNQAWKKLKQGGRLVLIAWNENSLGHELYGSKWLPLHVPQYRQIFSMGSLHRCVSSAGIHEKLTLFSTSTGQLPQAFPIEPFHSQNDMEKTVQKRLKEAPLSGEALVLICQKTKK
ncbi:MAG: methyltransferase domain-containing protein [Verrucomicrobia bacterium]|nr:methyltransferase domain-containing protein [Verrucomicrobiota bacterium]